MNILKSLKKDSHGFGHIETILIVLVVAAIAGVGFFVYQAHTNKPIRPTAHAGSWAILTAKNGIYGGTLYFWACRNPYAAESGTNSITVAITKNASTPAYWYGIYDTPMAQPSWSNSYWAGTIAEKTLSVGVNSGFSLYMQGYTQAIENLYGQGSINALPAC
ncbi:MAG TPA: hypothetical protein VIH90_00720 [Candidatus Saccharimonadales bacterium]